MSKIMNDNFKINVGNPIDSRYLASTNLPYVSMAAVNSAIVESQRYVGLTVNINNVEYWYETGVTDGNLIIKDSGLASTGVTAAYNGITKEGNAVKLGGTLTGATVFTKSGTGSLLKYAGDYSGEFDAQTIPDAEFVTGLTSQSITSSSNGLTKVDQDIKLGGTTPLDETTNICGGSQVLNLGTAASKLGAFTVNAASAAIISDGSADICPTGILTVDGSAIAVKAVASYDDDKSSSYTLRSLPDVNYVTGLTSGAIQTASNGLTKTGTDVCLGGILSGNTELNVGTNNFHIGGLTDWDRYTSFNQDSWSYSFITYNYNSYIGLQGLAVGEERIIITDSGQLTSGTFIDIDRGNRFCLNSADPMTLNSCNSITINNNGANGFLLNTSSSAGNMRIRDLRTTTAGLEYCADYSSGYSSRSLVDKDYVDTEIGSLTGTTSQALTGATNGLTKDGQDVKLGGTLTESTTLNLDTGNNFCISNPDLTNHRFLMSETTGSFYLNGSNTTHNVGVCGANNEIKLSVVPTGGGATNTVTLSETWGLVISTPILSNGARYVADYSANFVARSIPDAAWVTGLTTTSGVQTASNGLTKTGTNVTLGGALATDTQINLNNGNCLEITDVGNDASYIFDQTNVTLNNNDSIFEISNTGDDYTLTHCSGSNVDLSLSGLTYGGDYSANFKENTLVTKSYVDAASGGILANNGLTRDGSYISLGGNLTGDTTISSASHDNCLLITSPMCACDVHVLGFDTTPSVGWTEGQLYYDNCQLNFDREVSGVTLQLGEENVIRVENQTGSAIPNGAVVYVNGASVSGFPTVDLADTSGFFSATQTVGVATHEILNNNEGYITAIGIVHDVDTNGFATGSLLWLSTGGTFTDVRPSYPNYTVSVGMVTKAGVGDGEIYVRLLYVPNYTEYGLFTGYTASTNTTLAEKLDITDFNTYTGDTETRIAANEAITAVAITGVTNGLCGYSTHNACLGGTLSSDVTLSGAQTLTFGDLNGICMSTANTNDVGINAKSNGAIYIKSQSGVVASSSDMTDAVGISIDFNASVPMLVTDNRPTPRGLQYNDDYTSTYLDRSLVDKYYVDSIATGLNVHAAVIATTTAGDGNIVLSGDTGTIDTVSVTDIISINNRILVKNQTDAALNGIYSASTGVWGRTEDYNFAPSGEISNGDLIPVVSGLTNANSQWINVSVNPIVSGDSLNFSIFSQQQGIIEGNGTCVTTVGSNRQVAVKLSPSASGLCFDATALELDYNTFRYGLTCSNTVGKVDVRACLSSAVGDEILVRIDTGGTNTLFVDKGDFSYTTASNGLSKEGCNVVLGGALTGNTIVSGDDNTYDLSFTGLNDFSLGFNGSGTVTDTNGSPAGLEYASDYSSTFVDNSLVSKYFVNNAITGDTLTFNQGLTKTDDVIKWGGTLTEDRALLYGGVNFCVKSTGIDFLMNCSCVLTTNTNIDLNTCNTASGCISSIGLSDTGAMSLVANNATQGLTITSAAHGAVYAGDYSGSFVDNSLVSKKYVDDCAGVSGVQTANNGLTKDGTNVRLGGELTGSTCVYGNNTNFIFERKNVGGTGVCSSLCLNLDAELKGSSDSGSETNLQTSGNALCLTASGAAEYRDDNSNPINYAGDYSTNYVARSLVDAAYVTGQTTTASNGLTKTGTNVTLGGILSETTTISGGSQVINFGTATSQIGFNICGSLNSVGDSVIAISDRGQFDMNTCCVALTSCFDATNYTKICLDQQSIEIGIGSGTSGALEYSDDYHSKYNLRTLPDVAYVTGLTSAIETASVTGATNGLTKSGQDVKLGGNLTEYTSINMGTDAIEFNGSNGTSNTYVSFSDGYNDMIAYGGSGNNIAGINGNASATQGGTNVLLEVQYTGGLQSHITLNPDNIYIDAYDGTNTANVGFTASGFTYGANYSTCWTDRSLVDKAYVDNGITGATNTFTNGLTDTVGTVKLGGTLTEDTCINTDNQYGIAIGSNVKATGNNSFALGEGYGGGCVEASGNNSFAGGFGYYGNVIASGVNSFAFGGDYTAACASTSAVLGGTFNCILTTGLNSAIIGGTGNEVRDRNSGIFAGNSNTIFNNACVSTIIGGYGTSIEASCSSAIIGGRSTQLNAGNHCSVIVGGCNINVGNGDLPEHAIVPNLAIWNTPADDADGAVLVWDSSTKKVGKTTITIPTADVTGATNGLSIVDREVVLGGTLTGDTVIDNNKQHDILIGNLDDSYINLENGTGIELGVASGNTNINIDGTNDQIELTTSSGYINVYGQTDQITLGSNSTGEIIVAEDITATGIVKLATTPETGSATSDAVLVWNSTDKKVKQVNASNLGEDNNIYDMTVIVGNTTLTTDSTYVQLVNSPTSGITVTLPAAPIDGQVFRIKDAAGSALDYNITIARNGKLIDNTTTDGVLNTDGGALEIVYNNSLGSWFVFSFVN